MAVWAGRWLVVFAACAGAGLAQASLALADGTLSLVGGDKVSITSFTDSPDSFVGSVTVHATGGDVAFTAVPQDLTGTTATIDRSHVTLLGETTVKQGTYEVETVKVTGVVDPDTYTGKLTLATTGGDLVIPITVTAKEHPALAVPAGGQLKLNVTRCGGAISCRVAGWLVPDGGKDVTTKILLTNSGKLADTISDAQVFATGGVGGHTLTGQLVGIGEVAASRTKALTLTVSRNQVAPDHYTGSAYVTVKDGSSFLTVPVDVSVRSGPIWAILALVFGIVIGRLATQMSTKGNQQVSELWQLYGLRGAARRRLSDPVDRAALNDLFNAAAASIYAFDFANAKTQLSQISGAIDLLANAHEAAVTLNALPSPPANVAGLVDTLRHQIRSGEYELAKASLASLQALLPQVHTAAEQAAPDAAPAIAQAVASAGAHLETIQLSLDRLTNIGAAVGDVLSWQKRWLGTTGRALRRFVYWLAGIEPGVAADARLVIRPLLTLVLIFLLVGLGLKTLYTSNATFGSGGFVDYFALIIWGLSADIASRTLTNLGGNAAPAQLPTG